MKELWDVSNTDETLFAKDFVTRFRLTKESDQIFLLYNLLNKYWSIMMIGNIDRK